MTPITYLDFIGKVFGIPKDVRIPRITELIRSVDLLSLSSAEIGQLSLSLASGDYRAFSADPGGLMGY
ncbi:MAG: hypothetical protein HXS54_02995 [Theionarchaea archaeon]|nr:hypothetical protein [Theionarchaea archaeon]